VRWGLKRRRKAAEAPEIEEPVGCLTADRSNDAQVRSPVLEGFVRIVGYSYKAQIDPAAPVTRNWPETAFEEVPLNQCPPAVSVFVLSEGHSPVSGAPQKPLISPVVVRAPRLEPSLLVEQIRIVDVGPAV
jgi:hypothetical protein